MRLASEPLAQRDAGPRLFDKMAPHLTELEGLVELMLDGLNIGAVNTQGAEPDPDVALSGKRIDIKSSDWNRKCAFSLKRGDVQKCDGLILVRTDRPGLAHDWT